ncbi:uncharacterized protein [Miscanthus floridulus]|uniref:uncharacterized protein n=1 Tax=Miscanthus floridulus TaxID=154761 RepID=UPI0034597572
MDPNTKLILDELKSVQMNLTNRIVAVETSIGARVGSLEDAAKVFDTWKPKMDATVEELRSKVGAIRKTDEKVEALREEMTALRKSVSRSVLDAAPAMPTGVLPPPKVSTALVPAGWTKFSPLGHHEESSHQGLKFATRSPVKGTFIPPNPDPKPKLHRSFSSSAILAGTQGGSGGVEGSHDHHCYEDEGGGNHHLPKINFPPFDGSNPKLWLERCLDYFEMYFVPHRRWIKVSTMHLSGAVACWLQSVEDQVSAGSWEQFCQLVMNRFGKDQHELLIRHLFHIHQSRSVQEYIDKFIGLVDQLVAYGRNTDPIYYAMRFVDGLRAGIRAAMHMQHPNNLDTACVLAPLQEELVDLTRKKELRRPEPFTFAKAPVRGPMPLPHLQPRQERPDRPMNPNPGPERRGRGVDDKLSTLRDYRRARGLCVWCGEKWSRDIDVLKLYSCTLCRNCG